MTGPVSRNQSVQADNAAVKQKLPKARCRDYRNEIGVEYGGDHDVVVTRVAKSYIAQARTSPGRTSSAKRFEAVTSARTCVN